MTTKQTSFCGWDIGGAHLKLARSGPQGQMKDVIQLPCALWKGISELRLSLEQAVSLLDCQQDTHAITMTGELVDAFSHREEGVREILDCVLMVLPADRCHIFAGQKGWLSINEAKRNWQAVASMNWQASAMFTANQLPNGIFMDIGSTTCDIVPFSNLQLLLQGTTDHQRQRDGSLVYTGAIRTPLMAVADKAPLHGQFISLAAEWFATTADIWRLLDQLNENDIQDISADGLSWDLPQCRQRLARMLATDADAASDEHWQHVAQWFAQKQLSAISDACLQVLSAISLPADAPLIGAGVGRFMVKACAERLGSPYIDFSSLCQELNSAADHAPAAALALLAQQQLS